MQGPYTGIKEEHDSIFRADMGGLLFGRGDGHALDFVIQVSLTDEQLFCGYILIACFKEENYTVWHITPVFVMGDRYSMTCHAYFLNGRQLQYDMSCLYSMTCHACFLNGRQVQSDMSCLYNMTCHACFLNGRQVQYVIIFFILMMKWNACSFPWVFPGHFEMLNCVSSSM